jgi:hypothetical protein
VVSDVARSYLSAHVGKLLCHMLAALGEEPSASA